MSCDSALWSDQLAIERCELSEYCWRELSVQPVPILSRPYRFPFAVHSCVFGSWASYASGFGQVMDWAGTKSGHLWLCEAEDLCLEVELPGGTNLMISASYYDLYSVLSAGFKGDEGEEK